MNGLLFTADILKAKLKVLETGPAVHRNLYGLKEINQEPDRWKYRSIANIPSGFFFQHDNGLERTIHSKYHVGQVVYLKEAYRCDDVGIRSLCTPHQRVKVAYPEGETAWRLRPSSHLCLKSYPPLFMPAWAARHFVKILSVRPERLQSITPEDCRLEGVTKVQCDCGECIDSTEVGAFQDLWDSCYPKYPWSSNPFCFRYEIEKTVRPE